VSVSCFNGIRLIVSLSVSEGYFKFDDTDWEEDYEAIQGKLVVARGEDLLTDSYHSAGKAESRDPSN
jgi:hypothetical protein